MHIITVYSEMHVKHVTKWRAQCRNWVLKNMVHRLQLLLRFEQLRSTNLLCATLIQNTNFASGCKTRSNKYHTGLPTRYESQYWKKGREKKDKCMFRSWLLDVMWASERGTFTPFRTTWRAFSARSGWQTTVTWYSVWARSAARKLVLSDHRCR